MNSPLGCLAATAMILAAGLGGAQVTPSGSGYLFRVKFTPKEKLTYKIPTTVSGLGKIPLKLNLTMEAKVLKVKNGIADIQGKVISPWTGTQPQAHTVQIDSTGHVVGESALTGFCLAFPKGPLKPGDSFESSVPQANPQGKAVEGQAKYTFVGIVEDHKKQYARFEFKSQTKDGPSGAVLVSMTDGLPIRYFMQFKVPVGQSGSMASVKAILQRQ